MKESKTTYAYLIEHMQNPSFQKVWDIAYDFVHKLPSELCDELHESLNRGVDVLDSEPMLQMYIYAFGKMHNAKLLHAFNHMQDRVLKNDKIAIIDWGCGQGLATLCYHDYLKGCNSPQQVSQIVLIEPSSLALSRAELLCSCFYPDAEITAINKPFDILTAEDISIPSEELTIHLFSNILDVESYNLQHLILTVTNLPFENNEYIIVSPIQNTLRTQRLKSFASSMDGFIYYENYLDKRQLDEDRDWTCAVLLCSSITKEEIFESECGKVFEDAHAFFENMNNDPRGEESIEILHRLQYCAERGDKRCQNQLGLWYLHAVGTEQNSRLAFEWFEKAAEQDYASAFGNIGNLYHKGLGVERDEQKAAHYFKEGADRKHSACQYRLGNCYLKGIGVDIDKDIAFSLFMDSSLQGYAPAMFALYLCYLNGWGTEKNENVAIKYLKKAVKEKHAKSCYILGGYCQLGKLVDKNEQESLKLYVDSAKLGYALAQEKLGDIYRKGLLGCDESPEKSFQWYLKAAEQGRSSAQFYVGYYYASGYGINKNLKLAFEWYENAAEQKNAAALNNLAICFEYGKGTEVNLEKAVYYYEESAKLGNITAQKNLANCYKNGTGVKSNSQKEFSWTLEAAKNGDLKSIGRISFYYIKGYGTDINHEEALLWYARYYSKDIHINNANEAFSFFKKKSEEGDSQALYVIGKCFQYGVATDRNIRNAYTYYEKAADLGHIESLIKMHRISSLYEMCSIKHRISSFFYELCSIQEDEKIYEDKKIYNDDYGVKYSEDKKILIYMGNLKTKEYSITKGTRIICDNAFQSGDIETIIIPESVIVIGKNPFISRNLERSNIKSIICNSSYYAVVDNVLYTKDMKKIIAYLGDRPIFDIPEGVEIIGEKAFADNESIMEIHFPESLTTIEDEAFAFCEKLKRISLPKSVVSIGMKCFYGCESLFEILSLGNVNIIKEKTFAGCNLRILSLPTSLIEIGDDAFNSNQELEFISLPENVKTIGKSSFAFCGITHIHINCNLQEIGDFCFYGCHIENMRIPMCVKTIGLNPFVGTKNITCKGNERFVSENGLLYDRVSGGLISHYCHSEVSIYSSITHVKSFAFYDSIVTDIFMGENIIKIEPYAFYKAKKLKSIVWKNSKIEQIPLGCFGDCTNIFKIDIPSSVKDVENGALFGCRNLKTIRFYRHYTNVSEKIFLTKHSICLPEDLPTWLEYPHQAYSNFIEEVYERRDIDSSMFETIDIIVPKGCKNNYKFSSIYNTFVSYNHEFEDNNYNMDRNFVVIDDDVEK